MSYKLHFLGWCFKPETNNDKIWGWLETDSGSLYNFWGKRGKTLTFERHYGAWDKLDLQTLQRQKARKKGYVEIHEPRYHEIVEEFVDYLNKQFTMAKFSGKIRNDDVDNNSFI